MTEQQHPPCNFAPLTCPCGKWADEAEAEIARLKGTLAIARGTLDALDKSHADLAHRLADAGRENGRLRGELDAAAMAISRWLAHQWGPQEQYAKMREARDTVKHALEQGVMK